MPESLATSVLTWYDASRRDLPWRGVDDPYITWVSEIMLQQTRVDQATPYFLRFVEAFPDVQTLADAALDDVLLNWAGLGYYSRARNLHRAARMVREDHGGYLPETRGALKRLPGIGDYTSAAIASIAFGEREAVVDGNVIRVVSRCFALEGDRKSTALKREVAAIVQDLVPADRPGDFNQAMMDLGARICIPRNPRCEECPLAGVCLAYAEGEPERYPSAIARRDTPHYNVAVAAIFDGDRLLIQKRPDEGMLGGMWELPGGKIEAGESAGEACIREAKEELDVEIDVVRQLPTVKHAYSHFKVTLHPFIAHVAKGRVVRSATRKWIRLEETTAYAFPSASLRILEHLGTLDVYVDATSETRD